MLNRFTSVRASRIVSVSHLSDLLRKTRVFVEPVREMSLSLNRPRTRSFEKMLREREEVDTSKVLSSVGEIESVASSKKSKKSKKEKKEKKEKKSKKDKKESVDGVAGSKRSRRAIEEAAEDVGTKSVESAAKRARGSGARGSAAVDAVEAMVASAGSGTGDEGPSVSDLPLSQTTRDALAKRGITNLFPIQAQTLAAGLAGRDVVGRARTGMGKTLAFTLPVVERLLSGDIPRSRGSRGPPTVLVLAPTRELAKQVSEDFESVAPSLVTLTVYGGTALGPQKGALRRGVDVIVGTPGRVMDLMEQGDLVLDDVRAAILDEADRMLDMGFADDVLKILRAVPLLAAREKTAHRLDTEEVEDGAQVMLFSATLPSFVDKVARSFMRKNREKIDLVGGDGGAQASTDVDHLVLQCGWSEVPGAVSDLIRLYAGSKGRSIVFTETKKAANELAMDPQLGGLAKPLHGDIAQAHREQTLKAFKNGAVRTIVATDVAARGLDIQNVDLVVMVEPPAGNFSAKADIDTYVHRSGRTGRAGRKGTCVTLFRPRQEPLLKQIESAIGNKMTRIGAPQPSDIAAAAAREMAQDLADVPEDTKELFRSQAEEILKDQDPSDALSAALAVMANCADGVPSRSLLSSERGFATFSFSAPPGIDDIRGAGFVFNGLRRELEDEVVESVRGLRITEDGNGAVFDIPDKYVAAVRAAAKEPRSRIAELTELPDLRDKPMTNDRRGGGGGGGFRGGGRGRGRGGGGYRGGGGGGGGFRGGGGGRGRGGGGGFRGGGRGRGRSY